MDKKKKYRIEVTIIERGFTGTIGVDEREIAQINIETDDKKLKENLQYFSLMSLHHSLK